MPLRRPAIAHEDAPKALFVRLDIGLRRKLQEFISSNKDVARSEKFVVTRLIEAFLEHPDEERFALLRNPKSLRQFIRLLDESLLQSSMADHVFNRGNWSWAIQEYRALELLSSDDLRGVRNLAIYKQAYCWLDVAIDLRMEGLVANGPPVPLLQSAARSTFVSLEYLQRFEGEHLAIEFTKACAWSLAAQFSVEARLAHLPEFMKELRARRPQPSVRGPGWNSMLLNWRTYAGSEREALESLARECTERAISALEALRKDPTHETPSQPVLSFLLAKVSIDDDLVFLRDDLVASQEFQRWQNKSANRESGILTQFLSLYGALPDEIQSAAGGRG